MAAKLTGYDLRDLVDDIDGRRLKGAKLLLGLLAGHWGKEKDYVFVGGASLMRRAGIGKTKMASDITTLEDLGMMTVKRRPNQSSFYYLNVTKIAQWAAEGREKDAERKAQFSESKADSGSSESEPPESGSSESELPEVRKANHDGSECEPVTNPVTNPFNKKTGTQEGDRSDQDEKREKLNTDTDTVLTRLNADCGKQYRITDKTARSLVMRLMGNDGYTLEDLLMVIESKAAQWLDDDRTEEWLRPSTLFGQKFSQYHAEALASRAKREAQQKGRQDLNELARQQAEEEERRNAEFMATPVPAADMLGPIQWRAMKVDGLTFELFNRIMEAVPKDEKRLRNDWKRFVQEGLARLLAEPMTAGEARGARVKDVLHRLDSSRQAAALMALAGRDASETKTLTEWRAIAAGNNMERQTA